MDLITALLLLLLGGGTPQNSEPDDEAVPASVTDPVVIPGPTHTGRNGASEDIYNGF